ncbi:MAG: hypothetical protein ABEH88_10965 [Halobacteriales archaeon]
MNDVLGFVIVFAIVVTMIGLTFAAGFSGLQDVRDAGRVNNAERAFELLRNDIADSTDRGAPSRTTEITLSGGRLSFGDPVRITVSEAAGGFNTTRTIEPIVYHSGTGTRIVYAAGAILRGQRVGGTVRHPPGFVLSAERTVIPIVETRNDDSGAVAGDGTVLVRTTVDRREILYANEADPVTLWVNLTTPRARAWHDHLGDRDDVACEPASSGEVACRVTTHRAYVTRVTVNATFV